MRLRYLEADSASTHRHAVEGTWAFRELAEADWRVGPQLGTGRLRGWVDAEEHIMLDLNPGWEDNNVRLQGEWRGARLGTLEGEWVYSGFPGCLGAGRFEAVR